MRTRAFIIALTLAAFTLSACNTVDGAGQDMKAAGRAVSNTANKTKAKMNEE